MHHNFPKLLHEVYFVEDNTLSHETLLQKYIATI